MNTQGIGQFELTRRSGLSQATVFQILKKSERDVTRPPRRSTLVALAKSVGGEIRFTRKGEFFVQQPYQLPEIQQKELSLLLSELATMVIGKGKPFTKEDRETIVRVVKAVLG
jgi:hypothetical protein